MKTKEAIEHFGSQASLAQALGINRAAVHQWGEEPPIPRQYQIQVITDGALMAEDSRPETDPAA